MKKLSAKDLVSFEKMLMPLIIKGLMYLGFLGSVIWTIILWIKGSFWSGLAALIFGPLAVRLYAELMIVIFKINENLQKLVDKE